MKKTTAGFLRLAVLSAALALPLASQEEAPPGAEESTRVIRGLLRDGLEDAALAQAGAYLERFPGGADAAEMLYHHGRLLLARGSAAEAAASLEALLQKYPASSYAAESMYMLGVAEQLRSRPTRALEWFQKALPQAGLSVALKSEARIKSAMLMRDMGRCAEALEMLRQAPEPRAALARGWCRYDMQEFDAAEKEFKATLADSGLSEEERRSVREAQGMMAYFRRKYAEARDILTPLFAERPTPEMSIALAWCHYQLGDFAKAYDVVRYRSARLDMDEADARMLDARRALERGETARAEEALKALVKLRPEDGEAQAMLGRLLRRRGDVAGALEHLTQAQRLMQGGEAADVLFEIGEIHYGERRDNQSALRVFKALTETPGHLLGNDALLFAAKSALGLGDRASALEFLARLLEGRPSEELRDEAYVMAAEIHVAMGDYEAALKFLKMHGQEFPSSRRAAGALLRRADMEERTGRAVESIETLRYFLSRFPAHAEAGNASVRLAELLFAAGRYSDAAGVWKDMAEKNPRDSQARLEQGRCLLQMGKAQEAETLFMTLAAERPLAAEYWAAQAAELRQDSKAARMHYDKALQAPPQGEDEALRAESLREAASVAFKAGDEPAGMSYLRRLRELGGLDSHYSQLALEKHLLRQGKIKEALMEVPAFAEGDPAGALDAGKMLERALAQKQRGEPKAAEEFGKIVQKFPRTRAAAEARFHLAEYDMAQGKKEQALKNLEAALEGGLRPELAAQTNYRLGSIALQRKDYARAAGHFEEALASGYLQDAAATLHYLAAACHENLRNNEDARRHYLAFFGALADKKQMLEEQIAAALFLQRAGAWQDSLRLCESILQNAAGDDLKAEAQFYYAENLKFMGRDAQACVEYLKVTYLHPKEAMWAVTARFEAAKLYEKQGKWDEAARLYRIIAEASPGSVQGETARKHLEALSRKPAPSSELQQQDIH